MWVSKLRPLCELLSLIILSFFAKRFQDNDMVIFLQCTFVICVFVPISIFKCEEGEAKLPNRVLLKFRVSPSIKALPMDDTFKIWMEKTHFVQPYQTSTHRFRKKNTYLFYIFELRTIV
jgi:hypothetical protein